MKTLVISLFAFFMVFNIEGQVKVNEPYDFPVKPGSTKWESFSTGQEMVEACQIPNSILKNLTTKALAQTCLNYPLFFQYTASNDERKSIDAMIDGFNGLRELSLREDGFNELAELYKSIPVTKTPFLQSKAEDVPYKTVYLELLLANDKFVDKANIFELKNIKKTLLVNYNKKLSKQDVHSLYSIRKTLLLGSVVNFKLDSLSFTPSDNRAKLKNFIKKYSVASAGELTEISKIITTE